jgi:hypothetical protein
MLGVQYGLRILDASGKKYMVYWGYAETPFRMPEPILEEVEEVLEEEIIEPPVVDQVEDLLPP